MVDYSCTTVRAGSEGRNCSVIVSSPLNETIEYLHSSTVTPEDLPIPNYYWKVLLKVRWSGGNITNASAVGVWLEHKEYPEALVAEGSDERDIGGQALGTHVLRPDTALDLPDMSLTQKEHAESRLAYTAAYCIWELGRKKTLVEI